MSTTKALGDLGEKAVAAYLKRRGYTLLERQWRCRFGELDLVARDRQGTVCFVEVKLRSSVTHGLPREAVNTWKRKRLLAAAGCYLAARQLEARCRFDVAEIYTDENYSVQKIEYLEDAFEA